MPAAGPWNQFKKWLNAEDEEEDFETDMPTPTASSPTPTSAPKRPRGNLTLHGNAEGGMEIFHPRSLEERNDVGADLKHRQTVVLDLSGLPDGDARYFLEFVLGVVFALDATINKVSENIFLLAPRGVAVRSDVEDPPAKPSTAAPRTSTTGRGETDELFWQAR